MKNLVLDIFNARARVLEKLVALHGTVDTDRYADAQELPFRGDSSVSVYTIAASGLSHEGHRDLW